jgi:hypothetical protein
VDINNAQDRFLQLVPIVDDALSKGEALRGTRLSVRAYNPPLGELISRRVVLRGCGCVCGCGCACACTAVCFAFSQKGGPQRHVVQVQDVHTHFWVRCSSDVDVLGCAGVGVYAWVCMCGCVCVGVYAWVCMRGCLCVGVYVCVCVCVCVCVGVYVYVYIYVCVGVYVYVCMCRCGFVCGCAGVGVYVFP